MNETFLERLIRKTDGLGERFGAWLGGHGINILIIIFVAYLLHRFGTVLLTRLIRKTVRHDLFPTELDRKKRIKTLNGLIRAVVRVSAWSLAIVMILDELHIHTGPLLASAGVLGVTLGFGAQSLVKDFVSGIFIILENQYRVGDVVDLGTVSGTVEAITIRTTAVRDLNGHLHHVPNGTISTTTNKTMDFGQINEDLTVGMSTDLDELERLIGRVGEQLVADPKLRGYIIDPPQMSSVKGFSVNGIVVKIVGKVTAGDQWIVRSEFYRKLKKSLDSHNIEIPSQQMTLRQPSEVNGKKTAHHSKTRD